MRAKCDSCGAPIEWARFSTSGKPVPLDVGLVDNGNLEVVERRDGGDAIVRLLGRADLEAARERGVPLRRTHFATCPNAKQHRRQP